MSESTMLDELMEQVRQAAFETAAAKELMEPMLIYLRPDRSVCGVKLTVPGVHPADVAKVALAAERATLAALCMESWKVEIEATPEMKAELEAGRPVVPPVRPKDHPNRYDCLVLIGEIRGQPQKQRHWRINPGTPRTFEEQEVATAELQQSRFTPLFISNREAALLAYSHIERKRMGDQMGRN